MQTSAVFSRFQGGKMTLNFSYTFIYIADKQLFHPILISFSHKKACARPYRVPVGLFEADETAHKRNAVKLVSRQFK